MTMADRSGVAEGSGPALCPRCGTTLGVLDEGGGELLLCSACKGLFLGADTLARRFGRAFARAVERGARVERAARTPLGCPRGCGPMLAERVAAAGGPIHLDACPGCRGVWFDRGEVEAVRRAAAARSEVAPPPGSPAADPLTLARQQVEAADARGWWAGEEEDSGWLFCLISGLPLEGHNPLYRLPVLTWALIAACLVAFGLQLAEGHAVIERWGVVPGLADGQGVTLERSLASTFLHGGWLHLLGNLYFLWMFGDNVEDRLGRVAYLPCYLACGYAAALVHAALNPGDTIPMIGASGAISGLLGAYLVFFPHTQIRLAWPVLAMLGMRWLRTSAFFYLPLWLVWQAFLGLLGETGVAWWAHVGGFLAGVVLAFLAKGLLPDARVAALAATLPAGYEELRAVKGPRGEPFTP